MKTLIYFSLVLVFCFAISVFAGSSWKRTFGGTKDDWGNSVQQTTDGGYIIAGTTESYGYGMKDVWLIKTNASGYEYWDIPIGGDSSDYGNYVQQTTDGGYIIVGSSISWCDYGVLLIKTNASGTRQWEKCFKGGEKPLMKATVYNKQQMAALL